MSDPSNPCPVRDVAAELAAAVMERDTAPSTIDELVAAGADVHGTHDDYPILTTAVCNSNLAVVKCLLSHGADPNVLDRDECTPVHHALHVKGGWPVCEALIAAGADLDRGSPVIFAAAWGNHVTRLLELGVDPYHRAALGDCLAHQMVTACNVQEIGLLARYPLLLVQLNNLHETALETAASRGYTEECVALWKIWKAIDWKMVEMETAPGRDIRRLPASHESIPGRAMGKAVRSGRMQTVLALRAAGAPSAPYGSVFPLPSLISAERALVMSEYSELQAAMCLDLPGAHESLITRLESMAQADGMAVTLQSVREALKGLPAWQLEEGILGPEIARSWASKQAALSAIDEMLQKVGHARVEPALA